MQREHYDDGTIMIRFAAPIFLSAFLLFLVQPMMGKYILPWFGGSAGVWSVCLLFFQVMLLVGYTYAHMLHRYLSTRTQMIVHVTLLAASLGFLPIIPSAMWKPAPADNPSLRILLLLTVVLGLPYCMLSSTGPLLQSWFARAFPQRSPYRLYALSNVGSLLALAGYPFVVEPSLNRHAEALMWSTGFVIFAILCGWCAIQMWRRSNSKIVTLANAQRRDQARSDSRSLPPTVVDRLMWIAFPACASVMLLSVTTRITEDIAPIPFLWVLPLAVYLVTFIIAFEWPRLYHRGVFGPGVFVALAIVAGMMRWPHMPIPTLLGGSIAVLFMCCMACHGEVYRLRPGADRLTLFYLAIAGGGALGGAFVSLIAPLIFSWYFEFYLGLFATVVLLLIQLRRDRASFLSKPQLRVAWLGLLALTAAAGFAMRMAITRANQNVLLRTRNFYGVLAITEVNLGDPLGTVRTLEHGLITHGAQLLNDELRRWPLLYYGQITGVGLVMRYLPHDGPRRVGVVGLGTGTLATWADPGDVYRFYEINPRVIELAHDDFTFLDDSPGTIEIVPGDARLSMEREDAQNYDVLVLDAFSSDAIPTHLLTLEAFQTYLRHLKPNGVLAVHVSNRYLDLQPAVHRVGAEVGLKTVFVNSNADDARLVRESQWVLLCRNDSLFKKSPIRLAGFFPMSLPHVRLWTDEHVSVWEVMRPGEADAPDAARQTR